MQTRIGTGQREMQTQIETYIRIYTEILERLTDSDRGKYRNIHRDTRENADSDRDKYRNIHIEAGGAWFQIETAT
jgi:hypothetical protein